ncbi:MAG: hypothetical protein IPH28_19840 [Cytophagaceae bacterium]|nr:hypothetical protein [Cytophagaceae bacterium]
MPALPTVTMANAPLVKSPLISKNATGYANVSRAFYNISTRQIELQRKGTGFTPIASVAVGVLVKCILRQSHSNRNFY